MKSIKCLHCGLVNFVADGVCKRCKNELSATTGASFSQPANAFAGRGQATAYVLPAAIEHNTVAPEADLSGKYLRKMFFGALWAIGGTVATVASYGSASGGGGYMIFWGAILFGAIDFLIGLHGYTSNKS